MKRLIVPVLVLACGTAAYAQTYQKYLPLKEGNEWTVGRSNPVAKFAPTQIKVEESFDSFHWVTGFPGFEGGIWLAWSYNTLYAWDVDQWRVFLRFGAATGTQYTVHIGDGLWTNSIIKVAAKYATVTDPVLGTFTNCVRFTCQHPTLADAGMEEMFFAPNVGLLKWHEDSFVGGTDGRLLRAVINGHKLGPITFTSIDAGNMSQYPVVGTNKLLVINTQMAWQNFWSQHKPGTDAPAVDFSTKTVLVALAGLRPNGGYNVNVNLAIWNYPYTSARVRVLEIHYLGPSIQVITNPYDIVVMESKVYTVYYTWKVEEQGP